MIFDCPSTSSVTNQYELNFSTTSGRSWNDEMRENKRNPTLVHPISVRPLSNMQPAFPKNVAPSVCGVCNMAASGYHYDVPSCNGCKTFFRRTIIAKRVYECKNSGNCYDVTEKKKVKCRLCRFNKCVEIGMNENAIQVRDPSEDGKLFFIKRRNDGNDVSIPKIQVLSVERSIERMIEQLMYLELKLDIFRRSSFNPDPMASQSLAATLKTSSCLSLGDKYEPIQTEIGDDNRYKRKKQWPFFDLLTTVEYAKSFMFLHRLDEQDQVVLLKYVALICLNLMQGFFSYNLKSDKVIYPDMTFAGPLNWEDQRVSSYRKEMQKLTIVMMRNVVDKEEYVLLKAIMLCNPAVLELSTGAQELLKQERQKYSKTLFSYCLKKHGRSAGPSRFMTLLAFSDVLEHQQKHLKDRHVLQCLRGRPYAINKLTMEIMQ
ncbi:unnamed protein product [Caenorhabditis auriculariae]|uniref:Uncharacterized protein n=1 Tax=Caenorhabditis auriculariae TaxID=2777116 RepID=A0A8S1HC00_9PELO|nr:unnamed protein product [Caenorhabditis auriculariae]